MRENCNSVVVDMNTAQRCRVAWCPHEDELFAFASSRLHFLRANLAAFYGDASLDPEEKEDAELFSEVENHSEIQNPKSIAWSLAEPILGVTSGSTGSVSLVDRKRGTVQEFVPKDARPCNSLSWNREHPSLLACAFDKTRSDHSVYVLDTSPGASVSLGGSSSGGGRAHLRGHSASASSAATSSSSSSSSRNPNVEVSGRSSSSKGGFPTPPSASGLGGDLGASRHKNRMWRKQGGNTVKSLSLWESGVSESAVAVTWVPDKPTALAVGTSQRWLRIYDMNESQPNSITAHTRSVLGVRFDPFRPNRLATFSEDGIIRLWDIRMLVENTPVLQIATDHRNGSLQTIRWDPHRPNILASVSSGDENMVKLWYTPDQEGALNSSNSSTPSYFKFSKFKNVFCSGVPADISFHPTIPRLILYTGASSTPGQETVGLLSVNDPVSMDFSSGNCLAIGKRDLFNVEDPLTIPTVEKIPDKDMEFKIYDVSVTMKHRVLEGYGFNPSTNARIVAEEVETEHKQSLRFAWNWIARMRELNEKCGRKSCEEMVFHGLTNLLESPPESFPFLTAWSKMTFANEVADYKEMGVQVFSGPRRELCQQICGWGQYDDSDQEEAPFSALGRQGESSGRALENKVSRLLFQMNIPRAVELLQRVEETDLEVDVANNYKFLAMALSGLNEEKRQLWRKMHDQAKPQVKSKQLRAALAFIMSEPGDYQNLLDGRGLNLADQAAFACRFLPDTELATFFRRKEEDMIAAGDIHGLLLSGIGTPGSMRLLQNYLDRTADIQTVSLIAIHALGSPGGVDKRCWQWIEIYRDLLDSWLFWEHRALLDIDLRKSLGWRPLSTSWQQGLEASVGPSAASSSTGTSSRPQLGVVPVKPRPTGGPGEPQELPQVFLRCNFCQQVFAPFATGRAQRNAGRRGNIATRPRPISCPNCRKPLPRCAVTRLPYGSSTYAISYPDRQNLPDVVPTRPKSKKPHKYSVESISPVHEPHIITPASHGLREAQEKSRSLQLDACGRWFVWCQTCKHGGYAGHIFEWFSKHDTCAVAGCSCHCMEL